MAYRDESDPLKAKEVTLARELETLQRRELEVAADLRQTRAELRKAATPPSLAEIKIASPCSARWEDMAGDERVRFCGKCEKNVFNLSAMRRDEAELLLALNEGQKMCVRIYKRSDGTVLTADCPVGVKKKRARRVAALAALGGGAAAAFALAPTGPCEETPVASAETPDATLVLPEVRGAVPPTQPEVADPLPAKRPVKMRKSGKVFGMMGGI